MALVYHTPYSIYLRKTIGFWGSKHQAQGRQPMRDLHPFLTENCCPKLAFQWNLYLMCWRSCSLSPRSHAATHIKSARQPHNTSRVLKRVCCHVHSCPAVSTPRNSVRSRNASFLCLTVAAPAPKNVVSDP